MAYGCRRALALLALACAAAGCASFESISPGMPGQEVQARVGAPTTVWKNADGSELWQYPLGPQGIQAFMMTVGPDGVVREVHQAMSETYFSKVQAGMTRDDVHRLLGRPREIWYFPPRDEEVWIWRYYDTAYMFFNVLFDRTHGTVRTVQRLQEVPPPSNGGHRGG
jgi:hypothetical protein